MDEIKLPEWLLTPLFGAEGDEEEDDSEGSSGEGEGSEEDDEHGDDEGGEKESKGDGALSALRKERADRKRLERELRQLKRDQDRRKQEEDDEKLAEENAVKAAETKAQRAEDRARSLADRLRERTIDALIRDAARDANFHDVQDALLRVDRSAIKVEQDEDDPTDVEVDEDSVKAAVKAVADKNKHLIKPEGPEDPSGGGGFNGRRKGKDEDKSPASRFRI